MRTYYELENYHYEEIKNAGYKIGSEVYFQEKYDDDIYKGIISKFNITIDGEIEFQIDYEEIIKSDENEWDTVKERSFRRWTTIPMYLVSHNKKDCIIKNIKDKISRLKYTISKAKYYLGEIEKLQKKLE